MEYQQWVATKVNELVEMFNSQDSLKGLTSLDGRTKGVLAAVAVSIYLFQKQRTRVAFRGLQDAPPSYVGLDPMIPVNINGNLLRLIASFCNTRLGSWVVGPFLLKVLGVNRFRKIYLGNVCTTFYPIVVDDRFSKFEKVTELPDLSYVLNAENKNLGFRVRDAKFYVDGYKSGAFTPLDIARRILAVLEKNNKELNSFCDYRPELILEAARQSTERWQQGKTLSVVDGVPAAVKDQLAVIGHTRKNGLDMEEKDSIKDFDTVLVQRLRKAGIMIIGISHMIRD